MSFKDFFRKTKDKVLDVVFPNNIKCILCDRDIPDHEIPICEFCEKENIFNNGNRCKICDTPIMEGNIVCDNCAGKKHHFEKCFAPFIYDDKVRKAILKFKDDYAKYMAKPFVKYIYERLLRENIEFDIIVPVPSHKKTIKKRGYNPAKVLADELSILTGKPVCDVLVKNVLTKNQKALNFKDRQTNLKDTIILADKEIIKGKNILLVDDVITTCATMEVCSELMQKANKIYGCAISRTKIKS